MADHEQERVCQVCKYSMGLCARGLGFAQISLPISRQFKCTMVIPCKLGDHLTRFWRSEMKLQMTPTGEWYEFEVRKRGRKYYLSGEWEMFASIYRINHGDTLHFDVGSLVHEHLVAGHIRRLSGIRGRTTNARGWSVLHMRMLLPQLVFYT
ncbi:hypothetical protein ZWY2020_057710 [Hordeum vulgare]|nr:hypothetical protein ZWY2020_057710 [Hordeum vulgare]